MIPSERIYLLPYYHHFLRTGPAGEGKIVSPLDVEGEWLHKGIVYSTEKGDWIILAMRGATRESLILLLEQRENVRPEHLQRTLLTVKAPEAVVEAAAKLGITTFRFPKEPLILDIACSLCGLRIETKHYPWRCTTCPSEFGSDYRQVICHRCAIPFRTSPRLEREMSESLKDPEIWSKTVLCPDCRRKALDAPVLGFDGTVRSHILWGLLRGHLRLESLSGMGAPLSYVDRVIRPAMMKMAAMPKGSLGAKSMEMEPPRQLVGQEALPVLLNALETEKDSSMVAISTTVDLAMGGPVEGAAPTNELLELEIAALEQAGRQGILRQPQEEAKTYLQRLSSLPPTYTSPEVIHVIEALDADLVEACKILPENDLDFLLRAGQDIVSKVAFRLRTTREKDEDLFSFLVRLRLLATGGNSHGAEGEI